MEGLIALVDLYFLSTYRYCDRSHESFPEYTPRLLAAPLITVQAPDATYSLPAERTVELSISNFDLGAQTSGAPSISSVIKTEKPTGKAARIRYYDPQTATVVVQVDCIVTEVSNVNQQQANFVLREIETDVFQRNIGIRTIDRFPSADLASVQTEDPAEITPFGVMRRVDLTLCHRGLWAISYTFPNNLVGNYRQDDLTNITDYQIQPGDYLYYDVLWSGAGQFINFTMITSDGVEIGINGEVDQNNLQPFPTVDLWPQMSGTYDHWYRRKIPLADVLVGKTIIRYLIGCHAAGAGTYTGWLSNVFIGDRYGNIRKYILTPETGQPTVAFFARADAANGAPTVTYTSAYDYGPIRHALGSAISFSGTGSATVANSERFAVGTGFTFEGFIKTSAISGIVAERTFISGHKWTLQITVLGNLALNLTTSAGNTNLVAGSINTNTWKHFAITINDATKQATVYIDNLAPASTAYTGTFADNGGSFTFGTGLVGSIDDIRFWGKVLTSGEITSAKNVGMPKNGSESGLYGYWPFDDLAVFNEGTARDWTRRGNDMSLTNATVVSGALPVVQVVTVYRDGRAVNPVDWDSTLFLAQMVRFTRDQRDTGGRLMRIQADLFSLEFDQNFAAAERFVVSNSVYGLGLPVSTAAYATAIQEYRTAQYVIGHGLFQSVSGGEVLRYLHVRGAYLQRNASGEYEEIVDSASLHTATPAALGQVDGYWENCEIRRQSLLSLQQRVRSLTVHGIFDRGFSGSGSFLMNAKRTRDEDGRDETLRNPFLGDDSTVDRECDYVFKTLVSLDSQVEVLALSEFIGQEIRKLIAVHSPNMYFSGDEYQILRWQLQGAQLLISLGQWNPLLLTYEQNGEISPDTRAASITDFSLTIPSAPSSVSAVANGTRTGSNGTSMEALILVTGTAPSTNVNYLIFRAFQPGSISPQMEIPVPVQPGEIKSVTFATPPGLLYDYHVLARNTQNAPGYQDGIAVVVSSILSPGDTSVPSAPTAIALRQSGTKTVEIVVTMTEPADWSVTEVYRNTVAVAGGTRIDAAKKKVFHDQLPNYGEVWYYSARVKDNTGNLSGFSPVAGMTISRLGSNDYGDSSVDDNHLVRISAAKIYTGLLTVHPTTGGATAIFIDNSGKVRLRAMTSTPAKIAFEDASNFERATISGTATGSLTMAAGSASMVLSSSLSTLIGSNITLSGTLSAVVAGGLPNGASLQCSDTFGTRRVLVNTNVSVTAPLLIVNGSLAGCQPTAITPTNLSAYNAKAYLTLYTAGGAVYGLIPIV